MKPRVYVPGLTSVHQRTLALTRPGNDHSHLIDPKST